MKRRAWRRVIGLAALLAPSVMFAVSASPVQAGCAVGPSVVLAPASGATVPANPTLFVFLPRSAAVAASKLDELTISNEKSDPVSFSRTALPSEGPASVERLDVKASSGTLTLSARVGAETRVATFRIDARRRDTALRATEISQATYVYGSGCPSANGFLLSIVPKAPVYRVQLDGHIWIVPDAGLARDPAHHGTIVTGSVGCDQFDIATDRPLALSITPLNADGSEGLSRDEGCVRRGPPEACRPLGHGRMRCTGLSMACSSGGTLSVTGRVVAGP